MRSSKTGKLIAETAFIRNRQTRRPWWMKKWRSYINEKSLNGRQDRRKVGDHRFRSHERRGGCSLHSCRKQTRRACFFKVLMERCFWCRQRCGHADRSYEPVAVDETNVDKAVIEKELEIAKALILAEGKPANMVEKLPPENCRNFQGQYPGTPAFC